MSDPHRRRRQAARFRPALAPAGEGGTILDRRLLLSADAARGASPSAELRAIHRSVRAVGHPDARSRASGRTPPAAQINKQYNLFLEQFRTVEAAYVQSLNQQSTGTVSVTTTLTAPYLAGTASMQVQNAAVFGPAGTFPAPVYATAQVGGVSVGTYAIIGSSGNTLAINTTQSSAVSLASGTVLTAQVTSTASTSAAAIFPGYIIASTQQLAVNLVSYFNNLPFKLPRMFALPHQRRRGGAIQQFVFQVTAGTGTNSLEQSLLAVPLPLTPGADLQIYDFTISTAVNASRLRMLNGVKQIFAGKQPVVPASLGGPSSTSGTSSASTGTSGTGTTGGSTGTTA